MAVSHKVVMKVSVGLPSFLELRILVQVPWLLAKFISYGHRIKALKTQRPYHVTFLNHSIVTYCFQASKKASLMHANQKEAYVFHNLIMRVTSYHIHRQRYVLEASHKSCQHSRKLCVCVCVCVCLIGVTPHNLYIM